MTTDEICSKYKITNYTINDDDSVDVDNNVSLYGFTFSKLPLRFGKVNGYFECSANKLTTLEGAPHTVGYGFFCDQNNLTNLVGGPKSIGESYNCSHNKLTSLEGAPLEIPTDFMCRGNQLTSLEGSPEIVGGRFRCLNNNLTDLKNGPKSVKGEFDCSGNVITDLYGFDTNYMGWFLCEDNPIGSIFNEVKQDFTDAIRIYRVINNDRSVNFKRLKYVYSIFDRWVNTRSIERHYNIK
jgi:hypothetical protein